MEIYTSYFYMVRHMKSNMLPVSTAAFDPKWIHNGKGNRVGFIDKNGVLNGVRAEFLLPGHECDGLCRGPENASICGGDPTKCQFLKLYEKHLRTLDAEKFEAWLQHKLDILQDRVGHSVDTVVLLFHEKEDNPCSERVAVVKWLREAGIEVSEFNRDM